MLLSSLALGVGGDKKDTWRERRKNKTSGETDASLTDPLSAKETQQQIAALHRQIYP